MFYLLVYFLDVEQVIYGDTDSIMIYSGLDDIAKAKAIAGKVMQEVRPVFDEVEDDFFLYGFCYRKWVAIGQ